MIYEKHCPKTRRLDKNWGRNATDYTRRSAILTACITDLDTSLTNMNGDDFTHFRDKTEKLQDIRAGNELRVKTYSQVVWRSKEWDDVGKQRLAVSEAVYFINGSCFFFSRPRSNYST